MATGASPLRKFQSQPTISQQTDLLIQTLLHFGLSNQNNNSNNRDSRTQIIELSVDELAVALEKLSAGQGDSNQPDDPKLKKLVRSRVYDIHSSHLDALVSVRSWTMTEHVYRRVPCPFPTMARGLFTRENLHPDRALGQGRHAIVARGYDKFFNIDELPSTKWEALASRSQAPYHLTLKTNGCIIFLAALTPSDLLVTSKHATGGSKEEDEDEPMTHSAVGERWVERHLAQVGLSRAELARELWEANATAVAELTDDDFEEHVIATPADQVGLNLHGVNLNTPELITYPPEIVAQCAKRWGMHPTPFTTVNDIEAVKEHCRMIQTDGWAGRQGHIEGVVVRGTPRDQQPSPGPNPAATSIFWKVKFEEPYLTYREWRELTRKMLHELSLNGKALKEHPCGKCGKHLSLSDSEELAKVLKVNVKKIHKPETRLYVHWVLQELLNRPQTFDLWQKNRGIVATREAFFEWRNSQDALKIIDQLGSSASQKPSTGAGTEVEEDQHFDKTLLVPIGIPGCGKTTLAIALKHLTKCSHTQSDDITTKKTGPAFIENVKSLLLDKSGPSLVIADKNNHLKTHRTALVELIAKLKEGIQVKKGKGKGSRETELVRMKVRMVAVTWDLEAHSSGELHQIAAQRIVQRGENHQSLRPELTSGGLEAHDAILWRFLKTLEDFDPDINPEDQPFRHIIQLKFADSIENNLEDLCAQLSKICPGLLAPEDRIDSQKMKNALETARAYKPSIKKEMKVEAALQSPRYFGVKLDVDLKKLVGELLEAFDQTSQEPTQKAGHKMFTELVKNRRITATPHLTLVHQNQTEESEEMKQLWDEYQGRVLARKVAFGLLLGPKLIWNNRVMILEARVRTQSPGDSATDPAPTSIRYHVTIGTADESIRPVEGFDLLHHFFRSVPHASHSSTQPAPSPQTHATLDAGKQDADRAGEVLFLDVKTVSVGGTLKGLT
ncbi:hypothetical protein PGT21_019322 [Puccinia graminis f. sp. tritici]|uniref:tRNA ligase n=1 Tax=Puccinia graminis f. sp. tritici TaxID=56615 RepID=A0A5B0LJY7_PUCGR|nr:hypothetical protein PGT21_019322 [Puccinia graminis f. sp. tritici]